VNVRPNSEIALTSRRTYGVSLFRNRLLIGEKKAPEFRGVKKIHRFDAQEVVILVVA
jgi:hypothetical protein